MTLIEIQTDALAFTKSDEVQNMTLVEKNYIKKLESSISENTQRTSREKLRVRNCRCKRVEMLDPKLLSLLAFQTNNQQLNEKCMEKSKGEEK